VVAERLNAAGWRPPKRATFNERMVQRLLFRYGLSAGRPIWTSRVSRQPGIEWTVQEVATRTGIHHCTVYRWLRQGHLGGHITALGNQRIWIIEITEAELDHLKGGRAKRQPKPDLHRNPA
jgi:excisionase family DNA binding protein